MAKPVPNRQPELPFSTAPKVKQCMGVCVDGIPFITVAALATLGVRFGFGPWPALPFLVVTIWVAWFFRDPDRHPLENPEAIVSPADGKIIDIRRVPYPVLLKGEATRVSIFMSIFNVHVNRIPFTGTVRDIRYNRGKFFAANVEKASLENEQNAILIDTDRRVPILFVQIAGLIARRIVSRLQPGESVERGTRFGLIRFGSRCDIYLPDAAELKVRLGERAKAGETVLGILK